VSAGQFSIGAIKSDGTLWVWGSGNNGALGLNNTTTYSSPNQVGSLTNWAIVSFSDFYSSYAIKTDGTLWAWGYNTAGQLGLGNFTSFSSPKQVGSLTNWLKIAAGQYLVNTIKTDGTMWTWGSNSQGQLGLGNIVNYYSPVQVGALTTWGTSSSKFYNVAAIRTNGTLWTWGNNATGQLGLNHSGAGFYYSSPKQVGSLTNWNAVSVNVYGMSSLTT
jgi:alpha-tubulin suppressor-like RCC1 family protein